MELDLELSLPASIAAAVLSQPDIRKRLEGAGMKIRTVGGDPGIGPLRDGGATLIAVAATAGGAAAISGIFKLIGDILRQSHERQQLRKTHEHELSLALLQIGNEREELDLSGSLQALEDRLEAITSRLNS